MVFTSVSVCIDEVVLVIDCCELDDGCDAVVLVELLSERLPEVVFVLVPDCAVEDVSDGAVIGGVATLPAVPVEGVPLLVPAEVEGKVDELLPDVLSEPEAEPEVEPLSVLELLVVSVPDDLSVEVLDCDDWEELDGDGKVTVAEELLPDVPDAEELPIVESDFDELEGVDDVCDWLELDCAWRASVAANNATVPVLTNFRGIFIVTRSSV